MYVDPFVAGILCTVFVEMISLTIYGVIKVRRDQKNGR